MEHLAHLQVVRSLYFRGYWSTEPTNLIGVANPMAEPLIQKSTNAMMNSIA